MCIDPTLSVALGDKPPPLYICEECSQRIAGYASVSNLFLRPPDPPPSFNEMPFQTYITYCLPHYSSLQPRGNTSPWLRKSLALIMRSSSQNHAATCFSFSPACSMFCSCSFVFSLILRENILCCSSVRKLRLLCIR